MIRRWFLGSVLVVFVACGGPELRIKADAEGVTIDVQTLGEYQASISRIRLTDVGTSVVVWELIAKNQAPQIHDVRLHAGPNDANIDVAQGEDYEVLVPESSDRFMLLRGRNYLVEVWEPTGGRSSGTFGL